MVENIKIIGAGIAGLTFASHLEQQDLKYQLFEQAPSFKTVGAGILLANNAMQVFQRLGLAEQLIQKGRKISYLNLVDENLKLLSSVSLADFEAKYGVSNIAIHRADLQHILLNSISSDRIFLEHTLENLDDSSLEFKENVKIPYDVVVGADGIKSNVRRSLFGEMPIEYAGQICWRGLVNFQLPEQFQYQFNESWGAGSRFGFAQINTEQVYWFALCNYQNSVSEWDGENWRESFSKFNPLVQELLASTPDDSIHMAPISQLPLLKTWHKNSVCLIGDACHAMTPNMGQGAGQGIEDAFVLSHCLQKYESVEDGFAQYQILRFQKVKSIVNNSWQIGKIAQLNSSIGRMIRNLALKITPKSISQNQIAKVIQLADVDELASNF